MIKPRIGFIGLGLMGSAMVQRLLDLDYPMAVMANTSRTQVDAAVARGATEFGSARDVATASDIVMLCMGTSEQVESRMLGERGVIAGAQPDCVVIDFGTSLPASTRMLANQMAQAGCAYLDAPLGRTPAHAAEGKLNIMAAGERSAFVRVKPVLDDLGENVFYLGASGTGHTVKLINNFFGMTTANAMAEALAAADLAGVDRQALYDVMSAGPLHSGMMDFVSAYGLRSEPDKLAFSIANAAKDVGYYREMVANSGGTSIMANGALTGLRGAVESGRGENMVSQMVDFYADKLKP